MEIAISMISCVGEREPDVTERSEVQKASLSNSKRGDLLIESECGIPDESMHKQDHIYLPNYGPQTVNGLEF